MPTYPRQMPCLTGPTHFPTDHTNGLWARSYRENPTPNTSTWYQEARNLVATGAIGIGLVMPYKALGNASRTCPRRPNNSVPSPAGVRRVLATRTPSSASITALVNWTKATANSAQMPA